jgi:hypothetical protein
LKIAFYNRNQYGFITGLCYGLSFAKTPLLFHVNVPTQKYKRAFFLTRHTLKNEIRENDFLKNVY